MEPCAASSLPPPPLLLLLLLLSCPVLPCPALPCPVLVSSPLTEVNSSEHNCHGEEEVEGDGEQLVEEGDVPDPEEQDRRGEYEIEPHELGVR
eukprot:768283-Hanusia_phi.AAC.6